MANYRPLTPQTECVASLQWAGKHFDKLSNPKLAPLPPPTKALNSGRNHKETDLFEACRHTETAPLPPPPLKGTRANPHSLKQRQRHEPARPQRSGRAAWRSLGEWAGGNRNLEISNPIAMLLPWLRSARGQGRVTAAIIPPKLHAVHEG